MMVREIVDMAVALTRELVAIPSESSEPTTTTGPCEAGIVEVLARLCSTHNIPWSRQEVLAHRCNFLATFPQPGAPKIICLAHMDTVSARGMRHPFAGALRKNAIWGRGACDDKGPLAALLSSLIGLKNRGLPLRYEVTLVGSVDEECSMAGSAAIARQHPEGWDLCLSLEPSLLQPISAHIGVYRCRILPGNETAVLAQIQDDLAIFKEELEVETHPKLGAARMTVTQIDGEGGRAASGPDRLLVDIRLLPSHNPAAIHGRIERIVGDRGRIIPLFTALGIDSNANAPLIGAFRKSLVAEGFADQLLGVPFPSDCSQLRNRGPCLVWGPGDPKVAHGPDECIGIDQIEGACRVLCHFFTRA